jgi:hypothetical protein
VRTKPPGCATRPIVAQLAPAPSRLIPVNARIARRASAMRQK